MPVHDVSYGIEGNPAGDLDAELAQLFELTKLRDNIVTLETICTPRTHCCQ